MCPCGPRFVLQSQPAIRIHLLGSVRVETGDAGGPPRLTPTLQGLLAFLAIHRRRSHSRDVLFGHFWGDQPQERARHCLNTAVWRLRRLLEVQGLDCSASLVTEPDGAVGLRLSPGAWLDVAEFEQAAARIIDDGSTIDRLEDLIALDRDLQIPVGELLEGFYDHWALEARERFRSLYISALTALCHAYRRLDAPERAVRAAEQVLAVDPLRENVIRELMRAAVRGGNRGVAIQHYVSLRRRLRTELATEPMAETTTLFLEIAGDRESTRSRPETPAPVPSASTLIHDLRTIRRGLTRLINRLQAGLQP